MKTTKTKTIQFPKREAKRVKRARKKLSPARRTYEQFKNKYPGGIPLFHFGDFYEVLFEEAKIVSCICDLIPDIRNIDDEEVHLVSIPICDLERYSRKMLEAGYIVVVCDWINNRQVVRIMTPGTVSAG